MTDIWNEPKKFIIPGAEDAFTWSILDSINRMEEAYWLIQCPEPDCMELHERIITTTWQREDGNEPVGMIETHCFTCTTTGKHYKIMRKPPFFILGEIPVPAKADVDDEPLAGSFE